MKRYILSILMLSVFIQTKAQVLPGTLDVTGIPNMVQTINDLVMEAGVDDNTIGFETVINANEVSFTLDPYTNPITGITTTSEQNCTANIFRYSVYMFTQNAPQNVEILARTSMNSGVRFPMSSPYDDAIIQPLGPRDLTPENVGDYVTIPNDGSVAIKVFEFVGCRQQIPVQFKVNPSSLAISEVSNFDIFYTVVSSEF